MGVPYAPRYDDGHISATGDPIHFMLCSRVGFWGTADSMALYSVRIIQDGGRRHLGKISNGHISATSRPIHFMFGYKVGFSWTADPVALFPVLTQDSGRVGHDTGCACVGIVCHQQILPFL